MSEEVQVDPIVEQAKEMGWRPREEYEGDPERWVDASIFVARAPLFEKIDSQNKTIKSISSKLDSVTSALNEFAVHHKRVKETEYERALQTLRAQKKAAIADDDLVEAENIQERIDDVKEQKIKEQLKPAPAVASGPPPEFVEWVDKNKWYNEDEDLKVVADSVGIRLAQQGVPPAEVLKRVTEKVKEMFPEHKAFRNPNKDKAAAVESRTNGAAKGSPPKYNPSAEQREIARKFVKAGLFKSQDEYFAELKELGELE
jgi:hypothetical protein